MTLVDTHTHLMDPAFAADLPAVFTRAAEAGVHAMVCVGYDLATSRAAVALAQQRPDVWATVGVHPNALAEAPADWLAELRALAAAPRVVAIGETGLDYYRQYTPHALQQDGFRAQLALAAELNLPAVVHCRDADGDVLATVAAAPARASAAGVFHCFSGTEETMRAAIAAGYYISFAGPITFKNAGALRDVAARVPADRLLVETDAPYLSPMPYRGKRNEPARVRLTAACLAEVRAMPLDALASLTTRNAERLFGLPPEEAA